MGRREQRAELRSTWMVLEAREPGVPFRRKDIVDADARLDAERAAARNVSWRGVPVVSDENAPGAVSGFLLSTRTYLPALARAEDVNRFEARPIGPVEGIRLNPRS